MISQTRNVAGIQLGHDPNIATKFQVNAVCIVSANQLEFYAICPNYPGRHSRLDARLVSLTRNGNNASSNSEKQIDLLRGYCQMRVFGTGVLGTRYCRVPGSWYRAEGCVGPDRLS